MRLSQRLIFLCLLLAYVAPSRAVIFYSTGDPAHNTNAPAGQLAGSGWQWQGHWGGFLGTAISSRHFIAATHVGGDVGHPFLLNGRTHTTVAKFSDTGTDLTIWEVTPPFTDWAQLYTNTTEVGQNFVVIGRGVQRGAPIQVGTLNPVTKGWGWGTHDGILRWGENKFEEVLDANGNIVAATLAGGTVLRATFDANGGANECALVYGDSSGAAFIKDGDHWKLAGINYAVDGPYNTAPTGPGFQAAIFDQGGLYKGGENRWTYTPDLPTAQAGGFYLSRISVRAEWIRSIIGDPGVPSPAPILEYSTAVNGTFTTDTSATFDSVNNLFRTPNPHQHRFFRIRATAPMEITNLSVNGSDLVLNCRFP
ncbi:MAG TPA: hypothetical protein VF773_05745 [Verrucomicrobiae bacterium]